MPNEIFTINLNAQAIIPEAFILLGIVGTLLVDLAGEKTASRWAPVICYISFLMNTYDLEESFRKIWL